jgi:hypothetical protein
VIPFKQPIKLLCWGLTFSWKNPDVKSVSSVGQWVVIRTFAAKYKCINGIA